MLAQYGVLDVWTYLAGTVFIVLLPGPNSLFVLATGAGRGVRAGYQAAFGVFIGDSILMTLTAAGAASVLRLLPMVFIALKAAGAVYLTYLGIRLLMSAWRPAPAQVHAVAGGPGSPFRKALLLSLLNPKAILFLLSFFVQFVDPAYPHPALSFLILATILQICSAAYLSVLIFGGSRLAAAFRRRQGLARAGSGLVGVLFLWFAGRMAFEA
ncbi:leucine efflux protein LeuE [Castellaniella denitrificans]|jgi:leucine efflux protein|uniref:Leucine efflux protein LeuE n=1 Tax=Castellaniella denitrificans TaxID=56119 RepID=A0ABT4M6R1_9BURK|nr:leucine efflux protein LeuE [Castellaniella denitrificans]MCZ4331015.1 leucine efflux protein LeuE [Castellaniella denitrificans]